MSRIATIRPTHLGRQGFGAMADLVQHGKAGALTDFVGAPALACAAASPDAATQPPGGRPGDLVRGLVQPATILAIVSAAR